METFEPNGTKATATAISTGADISSQISITGDVDWYKFSNSSSANNIKVTLTTVPANYNERLFSRAEHKWLHH
jgi:hypothetical protein